MYNDLLPINEDWYDDKAKESLKWDDSDTALVGIGTVDGALRGSSSDNSNAASGAIAGMVGSYIGTWIGKGIVYLVYKAKAHSKASKRERAYKKDSGKDYTNSIIEFVQSPCKGADSVKRKRINGMIQIKIKNSKYSYLLTYDNDMKSFVIDIYEDGNIKANMTPKNKSDANRMIRNYFSPYVSAEDLDEYFEKGYGYLIVIDGCPENEFSKDIKNMGDSIIKKRTVKEESEYYNDLL